MRRSLAETRGGDACARRPVRGRGSDDGGWVGGEAAAWPALAAAQNGPTGPSLVLRSRGRRRPRYRGTTRARAGAPSSSARTGAPSAACGLVAHCRLAARSHRHAASSHRVVAPRAEQRKGRDQRGATPSCRRHRDTVTAPPGRAAANTPQSALSRCRHRAAVAAPPGCATANAPQDSPVAPRRRSAVAAPPGQTDEGPGPAPLRRRHRAAVTTPPGRVTANAPRDSAVARRHRASVAAAPGQTAEGPGSAPSRRPHSAADLRHCRRRRSAVAAPTAPPDHATTDAPRDNAIVPPSQRRRIEQPKGRVQRRRAAPLPTRRKIAPSRRVVAPRAEQPNGRDQRRRATPSCRHHRDAVTAPPGRATANTPR